MSKKQWRRFLLVTGKYTAAFVVIFVLLFAKVDSSIAPFAFAAVFAMYYLPVNKIVVAVVTFGLSFFVYAGSAALFSNLFTLGVFVAMCFAVNRLNKKFNLRKLWTRLEIPSIVIFYIFSNTLAVILNFKIAEVCQLKLQ